MHAIAAGYPHVPSDKSPSFMPGRNAHNGALPSRPPPRQHPGHAMRQASLATLLCVTLLALLPARAEDVAEFFRGKTVRIIVGVGVGSGYDLNARLLARHLPNYIPGHPAVIVQNQPGAGSLTMTNQLFIAGPFDGTAIGASFNGMPTTPLLQPAAARFDPTKFNWLGSTNRETQVTYVWHTAPVQSFDDLKATELIVGVQAPGSTQYDFPVLAN